MKKTKQIQFQDATYAGQWDSISKKKNYTLINLYTRLKTFFSRDSLNLIIVATVFLISSNISAQTFSSADIGPFNIEDYDDNFRQPIFIDFDGDGDLDLLTTNEGSESFFYQENVGDVNDPNFAIGFLNPFGLSPSFFVYIPKAADIDGDGDIDVFASGEDGLITFYENIGTVTDPEFAEEEFNPFGLDEIHSFVIDMIDLDNDGDLDLLAGSVDYEEDNFLIGYFENIGLPTAPEFAAPILEPFGLNPTPSIYPLSVGDLSDLDLDGDFDLIRTDYNGSTVYYHENIGTPESPLFTSGDGLATPFGITSSGDTLTSGASFADIDGDGDQDVFIFENNGNTYYFENTTYTLGIPESVSYSEISIFPNPSSNFVTIQINLKVAELMQINVLSIDGSIVKTIFPSDLTVNVTDLSNGTYVMELITNDQTKIHKRFVKN